MVDGEKMLELIISRQSDRKYSDKPVEKEKLEGIIEAGRMAPSACNAQPWKFIVVTEPELFRRLQKQHHAKLIGMNSFVASGSASDSYCKRKTKLYIKSWGNYKEKDYSLIDIGIASENICLQAKAEGIGSCMIGWFDERSVKKNPWHSTIKTG